MDTTTQVEHADFEALFLAYNRIRRDLDVRLKPLGLTLTSLQALMAIETLQAYPPQCTRAAVAARLGITNSTASIVIGGLIDKGLVLEDCTGYDLKRKPLKVSTVKKHISAYYGGLAVWDAVLEGWQELLPTSHRRRFFDALRSANSAFDQASSQRREQDYLKSLKKHSTRARALSGKTDG